VYAEAKAQQVSAGNGSFQLLRSSKSNDAAVIDNREAFAERVGFFHVVGGQQDCFAALIVFANDFPQEQAGLRVEASAGFVEKRTCGSCIMARAMERRCIMPPEKPRTIWSARSVSLKRSRRVAARLARS